MCALLRGVVNLVETCFERVPPPHVVIFSSLTSLELASCTLASPTPVAARGAALDTDFGLHFLHVRPPASELDSVQLVGGGAL